MYILSLSLSLYIYIYTYIYIYMYICIYVYTYIARDRACRVGPGRRSLAPCCAAADAKKGGEKDGNIER